MGETPMPLMQFRAERAESQFSEQEDAFLQRVRTRSVHLSTLNAQLPPPRYGRGMFMSNGGSITWTLLPNSSMPWKLPCAHASMPVT